MHESSWRPLGMPTAAGRAAKHSMRDDRRSQDFTLGDRSVRNDIAPYMLLYCIYCTLYTYTLYSTMVLRWY